jgi:DNA (cytosine-5)-methyltransferase 1
MSKSINPMLQERINFLSQGQTMRDLPENLQHLSFKKRSLRRVMDGTPTDKRGGAPSGLKRLVENEPSLTITSASSNEFVHPTENRLLTLRECARIQGFPDDYELVGSTSSIATQIGNAIPPIFMRQLVESIISQAHWRREKNLNGRWLGIEATKASALNPALAKMLNSLSEKTLIYT